MPQKVVDKVSVYCLQTSWLYKESEDYLWISFFVGFINGRMVKNQQDYRNVFDK